MFRFVMSTAYNLQRCSFRLLEQHKNADGYPYIQYGI